MDHTSVVNSGLLEQHFDMIQENTPLPPDLKASFVERNQHPYPLEPELDLDVKYQLLSQEKVDALQPMDKASNWKLFDQKFPETVGFIYLSRVGFSDDMNKALIYYEQYHYDQPLIGGYTIYTWQDGEWVGEGSLEWMT